MNSTFLENNESLKHKNAKEKLFKMITLGVKIYDQNNKKLRTTFQYCNEHKRDDEDYNQMIKSFEIFLQMEGFVLNWKNSVLYSNTKQKQPCFKYLGFNYSKNKNLLCNQKGNFGYVGYVPCKECIEKNYNGDKLDIGFIPDISYGKNGKYEAWFEIKNTNPISIHKIIFCYYKKIDLFEIESDYILDLDIKKESIKAKKYFTTEDLSKEESMIVLGILKYIRDGNNKLFGLMFNIKNSELKPYQIKSILNKMSQQHNMCFDFILKEYDKFLKEL